MSLVKKFKLKKINAPTKLAYFDAQPNWGDLTLKIANMFSIPPKDVGVVFIDKHKEPVTLTNDNELQDFYQHFGQFSEEIKFVVQDLQSPDPSITIASTWSADFNISNLSASTTTDDELTLICWILSISNEPFPIDIRKSRIVGHLKDMIKKKNKPALVSINASTLVIWKLSSPIPSSELSAKLVHVRIPQDIMGSVQLNPLDKLSEHFSSPSPKHLHIVVQLPHPLPRPRSPESSERPAKRLCREDQETPTALATQVALMQTNWTPPCTPPPKTQETVQVKVSPPRLNREETEEKMAAALAGFEDYIKYLATGRLDGFLDSIRPEDKVTDLKLDGLPCDPILLIHDLGKHIDHERIRHLFAQGTVHLFNVSGSGKTRLLLDGLCKNWGLYVSCRTGGRASGSDDFQIATEILQSMSTWHEVTSPMDSSRNTDAADRAIAMLLCARIFILNQFVQHLPLDTDVTVARRRWVLAQVLPPCLASERDDLFVKVLRDLRAADTKIMLGIIHSTLQGLWKRHDLFPAGSDTFFAVIDEAQVAADQLKDFFLSESGADLRPVLRAMYNYFQQSKIFHGIILAGTGLSMDKVKVSVGSSYLKWTKTTVTEQQVFTNVGCFVRGDPSQEEYIRRYLTLSDNNISDQRLLERMLYWFSGRYRPTASLIELFLCSENVPRHRVLTLLVERTTGFKLTDAIELEENEPPIPPDLCQMLEHYGRITTLSHLLERRNSEDIIECLVDVFMRWTFGSETTFIPIEGGMHIMIAAGIGFLDGTMKLRPNLSHPVYLSEPLIVLSLASAFEEHDWTKRQAWVAKSLRNAPNSSARGFAFEVGPLLVLMEIFGGKFRPLADAFHCSDSLGSRKATLVSLKRRADGVMQSYPVSWNAGSSDRLGFQATSPDDVLRFLHDPGGKAFLFPDTHMGPDLLCFLRDEKTDELTALAIQVKTSPHLDTGTWLSAIVSIVPRFFYTMMVKGERVQYAPVSYPDLPDKLSQALEAILGKGVYEPVEADNHRTRLRSSTRTSQQSATRQTTRQTPNWLRVIVTPDAQQQKTPGENDLVVLRWDAVKGCLGSTADMMKGVKF